MNPHSDRATETRRMALVDQVEGLERRIADGHNQRYVTDRLADTSRELATLDQGEMAR